MYAHILPVATLALLLVATAQAATLPASSRRATGEHVPALQHLASRSPTDYAPRFVQCPSAPLVRTVSQAATTGAGNKDINGDEAAFVSARTPVAHSALVAWLATTGASFDTSSSTLPNLALASSGGGFRAMLTGAGVHQAFDKRESAADVTSKLKGLYQAMTWESGLSGGGWLLSSVIGNNWPTITNLKTTLWYRTLAASPLLPDQVFAPVADVDVVAAVTSKNLAGFDPTLIDVYGRLLSYVLLKASEGGIKQTMSSIASLSGFTSHANPFPIITAIESPAVQQCDANLNATQYEFTPFEFGSWDAERAAFIPSRFIGSVQGSDGKYNCVKNYDNLGYVLGTSSDIFPLACSSIPPSAFGTLQKATNFTQSLLLQSGHRPAFRDVYATYPNVFVKQTKPAKSYPTTGRSDPSELYLLDGGFSSQINPIWPHLHRDVDVLFVVDNGSEMDGYPDGSDMRATYVQAQARGLTRMPYVPDNTTFVARGYNKRPTFFGCNEASTMTIVYMPNTNFVYPSNTSTFKIEYTPKEVDGMLANGQAVATNNGTQGYETCVACAVMKKTGTTLPAACTKCLQTYCATP